MNFKIKEVYSFETSDGKLFTTGKEAKDHQTNIVGEILDSLLPHDDRGNVTQIDRYNLLIKQLKDPELLSKVKSLYEALTFSEEG